MKKIYSVVLVILIFSFMQVKVAGENVNPLLNLYNIDSLYNLQNQAPYKQISSHNLGVGGLGDFIGIKAGETRTIFAVKGSGIITNIWLTFTCSDKNALRKVLLKMYWDDEKNPSVEVPIGDFFGVGFSQYIHYTSLLLGMSSGGYYSFFPMPFKKSAKIEIINNASEVIDGFFYNIGYREVKNLPKDTAYFHAKYRQEIKTQKGKNYLILNAKGKGNFVGLVLNMWGYRKDYLMFLEGDEIITVDEEKIPSVMGTGTEDYFLSGYYFNKGTYYAPLHGCLIKDKENSKISAYRFRIADAIPFNKEIKVEIEHGINSQASIAAYYSSVAYWYQTEPHYEFYTLPPANELAPPEKLSFK